VTRRKEQEIARREAELRARREAEEAQARQIAELEQAAAAAQEEWGSRQVRRPRHLPCRCCAAVGHACGPQGRAVLLLQSCLNTATSMRATAHSLARGSTSPLTWPT
jgi:hypothetical protein